MNLIVAIDQAWGIGKNNNLLTYLPLDLKFFKSKTLNNIIIMGRKTVDSLPNGKLLPNRTTWILTKDKGYKKENAVIFHSVEEVLSYIRQKKIDESKIFVSGGAMMYKAFLPYCKKAYLTKIQHDFQADISMICLDEQPGWYLTYISESQVHKDIRFNFTTYMKKE